MALQPGFFTGPPPQAVKATVTRGGDVFYGINPDMNRWIQNLWNWTVKFGNNADGAASFSGSIAIGTSPNWFKADASGIWLGGATFAASPFSVSMAGSLSATSGAIGGWSINSAYLAKDTGTDATSSGMAPSDYPFYAGAKYANRASAPFRITPAGAVTATSVQISSNGSLSYGGNPAKVIGEATATNEFGLVGVCSGANSTGGVYAYSTVTGKYAARVEHSSGASGTALYINGKTSSSGYIEGSQLGSTVANGTAPLVVTSSTNVANLYSTWNYYSLWVSSPSFTQYLQMADTQDGTKPAGATSLQYIKATIYFNSTTATVYIPAYY